MAGSVKSSCGHKSPNKLHMCTLQEGGLVPYWASQSHTGNGAIAVSSVIFEYGAGQHVHIPLAMWAKVEEKWVGVTDTSWPLVRLFRNPLPNLNWASTLEQQQQQKMKFKQQIVLKLNHHRFYIISNFRFHFFEVSADLLSGCLGYRLLIWTFYCESAKWEI